MAFFSMSAGCRASLCLEYTCNKYCDLIGHLEVSISHRDLQILIETYKFVIETYIWPRATEDAKCNSIAYSPQAKCHGYSCYNNILNQLDTSSNG